MLTDTSDSEVIGYDDSRSFLKPGKVVSVAALPFDLKACADEQFNRPVPLDLFLMICARRIRHMRVMASGCMWRVRVR